MRANDEKSPKNIDTLANVLANNLADHIYRDTLEKDLMEGDFFMTVEQVSEHYDVSRTIAREAVSQLRALGILQSRQRKGLLIGKPDPIKLMARWVPFYGQGTQGGEVSTLAQLRYALEVGAVDLAVAQASPAQIEQLAQTAEEFEKIASIHGHNKESDEIDLAFHGLILEMTGNPLITGMHRVLSDYFHASKEGTTPPDATKAIREHFLIADAFERNDGEAVRSLLRNHLEGTLGTQTQTVGNDAATNGTQTTNGEPLV